jgi:signal peptidase I
MDFDFAAFLVLATFISGIIWLLDVLIFARQRKEQQIEKEPVWVEYARSFFPVFLVVLLLRSFLVEPFRIPSASMMPTLLSGDFILVNKFTYGIRLPVINIKVYGDGAPRRGDIAVFRYPKDPGIDYIKRVVGLPGDKVAYFNKILYINGKPMPQEILGVYSGTGEAAVMNGTSLRSEQLDDVEHRILVRDQMLSPGFEMTVPDGEYFVMGDNRDHSNDSRFWGTVPDENLVGRAFFIWLSWNTAGSGVNWNRLGTSIK